MKLHPTRSRSLCPLKFWRIAKSLSQTQAAQLLHLSSQVRYSHIEQGVHFPSMAVLEDIERRCQQPGMLAAYICWYFGLTADEIRTVLVAQPTGGVVLQ